MRRFYKRVWKILEDTIDNVDASDSFSRGAALAFYSVTSLVPVLIIAIAIAGGVFGEEAARGAIVGELRGLIGRDGAEFVQDAIVSASRSGSDVWAVTLGALVLVFTASGVFGELQAALNTIWKCKLHGFSWARIVRGRLASLGLVVALGFLMLVSLVIDAGVTAAGSYMDRHFEYSALTIALINTVVSFALVSVLFTAIYKILPDKKIPWQDVVFGASVTAALFTVGKFAIGAFIGSSRVVSSYGAAGALAAILLWIYYSALIFLLGASFTKAVAISQHRRAAQIKKQAKKRRQSSTIAQSSAQKPLKLVRTATE
jgi:membrane protein